MWFYKPEGSLLANTMQILMQPTIISAFASAMMLEKFRLKNYSRLKCWEIRSSLLTIQFQCAKDYDSIQHNLIFVTSRQW